MLAGARVIVKHQVLGSSSVPHQLLNRTRSKSACSAWAAFKIGLDPRAQNGNALDSWELWKRGRSAQGQAKDTLPYLASASRWGISLRLADPALACILVHGL
jgi:hypothetical protein